MSWRSSSNTSSQSSLSSSTFSLLIRGPIDECRHRCRMPSSSIVIQRRIADRMGMELSKPRTVSESHLTNHIFKSVVSHSRVSHCSLKTSSRPVMKKFIGRHPSSGAQAQGIRANASKVRTAEQRSFNFELRPGDFVSDRNSKAANRPKPRATLWAADTPSWFGTVSSREPFSTSQSQYRKHDYSVLRSGIKKKQSNRGVLMFAF
ncbi:hypothetical protein EDB81DRAFT_495553 [Dactylonectria macrodidyma]|uniref:Uncharacterized protein n=1 Tax=Dactylonectria macrodidyma TaxID=307937 RepID=A0A9P9EWC0_9HYPO|nr:hypothetical protein EDB81DRAFT_495553 [Dactylonectria macrodidyma]